MALLHTSDRICASCGGMNGRHQLACTGDESVELISVYTRRQAIDDGIMVDCEQAPMGEMRRQLLKWPLAMTATAFHRHVWSIDEGRTCRQARVWKAGSGMCFGCSMRPSRGQSQPSALTLATCCSTSTASLLIRYCAQTRGLTRPPGAGQRGCGS